MMMNVMAMWILLSTLGAAMVMSPDPLGKTPNGERPLDLAKEATRESLHYASEAARQTGESIRRTVTSASQIPGKAAQTVQQVIKGGSQAGLEKIGLAQPVQPPSNLDVLKSRIQASEEKMAALKEAAAESARNIQLDVEETIRDYTGTSKKPPTRYEVAKEKIAGSYDATKDTAGETVEAGREKADHVANAVKEAVVAAGLRVEEGAHETYKSAEDRVSESSDFVDKLAQKIVQSVEDDIGAASTKTSQISKSAYKRAADGLRQTATRAKRTVGFEDRAPPTYQQRIQEATEQAADILKSRGAEAASFLPNVGQGLAYGSLDTEEKKSVGEYVSKAGEWMGVTGTGYPEPGLKTRVGRYVEGVKNKLSGTSTTKGGDWREEFLNKLGIYSEADLSRKDVMVGKFTGFLSGGVFHKVGEALNLSVTATQDAARSAGQTVSETVSQTKATVTDGIKSAQDNLTRTSGGNKKDDDEGNSLKQSGANLLKKVSWITTAWVISAFKTAHLFAFASVYGTSLWITFVSGYVLSRSVPRHQFGFVQSRVFPTYLKLTASGQLVCLISYIGLHPWADADRSEKFEYLFLWGVLMTTLANTFILEPQATKLMFEKLKIEKDEGGHNHIGHDATDEDEETRARLTKVNSTFHVLHGYSSLANLLGLLGMTLHLWHLSGRISI